MKHAFISGTGSYLPAQRLSNDELASLHHLDTTDEWIFSRTGIRARHVAGSEETTSTMGAAAGARALEAAGLTPEQINMVIVATCTSDDVFPSTACLIQEALHIPPVPAFDLQAACSGFIF
jgi:3-oxoacyl-[acyl-carrier-protein] synthase III